MRSLIVSVASSAFTILATFTACVFAISVLDGMFFPGLSKRLLGLDADQITDASPIVLVLALVFHAFNWYFKNGFGRKK
jgi:hypothetical protein